MPLSTAEFTQRLTASGVMSAEAVLEYLNSLSTDQPPADGEALARELVRQKRLTKFQAEQIYAGKGTSLTLGNYVILDKLGQGGMGMVLKAEHKRMKRLVALKVMSPQAVKTPDALKRFHREVEAAAKLRHPNIVAADDADEAKGTHFLVMEYVEGSDLSVLVKKNGPFPVDQAVRCIVQAARGLEYAHKRGVVHRDIKPANLLLLDREGTVKILDMGLARIEDSVGGSSEGAGLTSTGTIMGTVDYMSPEQAMDTKHADARSDIYSLGCTLYYLLTGRSLYDGDTIMKKLMAHRESAIPELSRELSVECREPGKTQSSPALDSQLSSLDFVFTRMVAKKPQDRPQSMTEVIAELERCLSGGGSTAVVGHGANSLTAGGNSESGSELQNFLKQISSDGLTKAGATTGGSARTAVAPSAAESETMISAAEGAGTDPRTDQTLTLEQVSQRSGEPRGVDSRTVRGLTHPGSPKRQWKWLIGLIAVAVVVLLAVVFAVRDKSGTLVLEINDGEIKVTLGDTGRTVRGKAKHTLSVPVGELVLHVEREDLTFKTDPFDVPKGEPVEIKVERVGRAVRAMQGKTLLGRQESPSSGVPPTTADFALEFDGVDDYVDLPSLSCDTGRPMTLEGWVTPFTADAHSHILVLHGETTVSIQQSDSSWHGLRLRSGTLQTLGAPIGTPSGSQPTHVAVVWDGSRQRLFVDGKGTSQETTGSANQCGVSGALLGCVRLTDSDPMLKYFFRGRIDEVRVSHSVRYATEFRPEPRFKSDQQTLALYHFDEAQGDKLVDSSGNNHHGTIVGAKWVQTRGSSPNLEAPRSKPESRPPSPAPINLLSLIDPGSHVIKGKWDVRQGELLSDQTLAATIQIPYQPPAEYDLHLTFTRRAGTGVIAPVLAKGDRQFQFDYAGWAGDIFGFGKVDGRKTNDNPTTVRRTPLVNGRKYTALLQVRNDHTKAWLDGELISELKTDYSNVSPDTLVQLRDSRSLGLVTNAAWTIHSLTLEPVIGDRAAARPTQTIPPTATAPDPPSDGTVIPLFNGKDLTGWTPYGGRWKWEDGELVTTEPSVVLTLSSDVNKLTLKKDFEVSFQARLANQKGMGNFQFRKSADGNQLGMCGFSTEWGWGSLYVAGSNPLPEKPRPESQTAVRLEDFNDVTIRCVGKRVTIKINGVIAQDGEFDLPLEGQIAWDVRHGATEFRIRKFQFKELTVPASANIRPAAPIGPQPPPANAPFAAKQARVYQEAWAKHLGTTVETKNSVGQTMILIPPGEFLMGSTDAEVAAALKVAEEIKADATAKGRIERAERPQHKVVITKPLLMSATEVTVGQFKKFVEASKYVTEAEQYGFGYSSGTVADDKVTAAQKQMNWRTPGYAVTDDSPVAQVTWNDAVAYCRWLSTQEKRTYRLPTEAEWEYACRAGTTTQFSFGDDSNESPKYGWSKENAGGNAHPVGTKLPNGFGLFDMHGNLYEWCGDFFDEKWYSASPSNDPNGPAAGSLRVIRGGLWSNFAAYSRSAYRFRDPPSNRTYYIGFRCVSELNVSVTARTNPTTPTSTANQTLDLIELFDIDKGVAPWRNDGAKNQWTREGNELKFNADGKPGLVKFPTTKLLDANYRLELEFTRTSGTNGFNLDLPLSSGLFTINLDEGARGRTGLGNSGQATDSFHIEPNRRYRLALLLEGQGAERSIRLEVDGQPLLAWKGNLQAVAVPSRGRNHENTTWPGIWIPARGSSFTIHRIHVEHLAANPPPAVAPFDAQQARAHQEAWARQLGVPVEYTNSIGMKFRLIPPGEFLMGSTPEEIEATLNEIRQEDTAWRDRAKSEGPQHLVRLTRPIYLGTTEVTQAQYESVIGKNPSHFSASGAGRKLMSGRETGSHPVETVSWHEVIEFCSKLGRLEKLTGSLPHRTDSSGQPSTYAYGLPTEAEWEFACRAGTTTSHWTGNDEVSLARGARFGDQVELRTYPVGTLDANPFGLFDMHGNVWEWVRDGWSQNYYEQLKDQPVVDPLGVQPPGGMRVQRGGASRLHAMHCRSSNRGSVPPDARLNGWGFRIALSVEAVQKKLTGADETTSLQFDGAGARVEIPSLVMDSTKPITIEAWTRPSKPVTHGVVAGFAGQCVLRLRARQWWFGVRDKDSKIHEVVASSDADWNKPAHVAGVFDGTHVRLFVDGIRHGEPVPCSSVVAVNTMATLGAAIDGTDPFAGEISQVRFSQVARYLDDFDPPARFTSDKDTLALHLFKDRSGTSLKDDSGHLHNGKIVNAKWVSNRTQQKSEANTASRGTSPDRAAAEWVIGLGGEVRVEGVSDAIKDVKTLPAQRFKLTQVRFPLKKLTGENANLVPLRGLEQVVFVGLDGTHASVEGLAGLEQLPKLERISLGGGSGFAITDVHVAALARLRKLQKLFLAGAKVTPSHCAVISQSLLNLDSLNLQGNNALDDAAVMPLGKLSKLRTLQLQGTKVTATGIAELKTALPNCSIEWDHPDGSK